MQTADRQTDNRPTGNTYVHTQNSHKADIIKITSAVPKRGFPMTENVSCNDKHQLGTRFTTVHTDSKNHSNSNNLRERREGGRRVKRGKWGNKDEEGKGEKC